MTEYPSYTDRCGCEVWASSGGGTGIEILGHNCTLYNNKNKEK